MSELINNDRKRKDLLKHMILQLHDGQAPEQVKTQLIRLLGEVPYSDVVIVEQELISEGLPVEEVLKLCDIHTTVLEGTIDQTGAKQVPAGHPVHTFREENRALEWEISALTTQYQEISESHSDSLAEVITQIRTHFNNLMDIEKHYLRKENLLFPYMEKHGITGPPTVMWGKHDETRELLKAAINSLSVNNEWKMDEFKLLIDLVLKPATKAIEDMIYKEEEILFPMTMDTLTIEEWYDIYKQTLEFGYCLYDPQTDWQPEEVINSIETAAGDGKFQLPSGSFTVPELTSLLNTIPFDLTFVDKNDKVRFFSQGKERIFARNRAILGRDVHLCHPPKSVHIVDQILKDFKSGKHETASFWIQMNKRFLMIEYFAMRDKDGIYLGCLEVSQDLTDKRALQGERRLLKYEEDK